MTTINVKSGSNSVYCLPNVLRTSRKSTPFGVSLGVSGGGQIQEAADSAALREGGGAAGPIW
jgi:hypothetical protein